MKRKISDAAMKILNERYFLKDDKGNVIEDWEGLCKRVSTYIASCEEDKETWAKEFYDLLLERMFLPNTPTLMNAGKEKMGLLHACYVIDIEDSMGDETCGHGITDSWKAAALIGKGGGGIGYPFSKLRPKGAFISTSKGTSSGPVSFMRVLDSVAEAVKQGGTRRIAQMGILSVDHPDILEFIKCKHEEGQIKNFNISVAITDKFMQAVKADKEYELIDPSTNTVTSKIKARLVWDEIIKGAWLNGEPGVIFIDTINKHHNLKKIGKIWATNPCLFKDTLIVNNNRLVQISSNDYIGKAWKTGVKKCIKVTTNAGHEIILTPDHKIRLSDKSFVNAENSLGCELEWSDGRIKTTKTINRKNVLLGYLFGDGFLCERTQGISVKINQQKESEVATLLLENGFHSQKSGAFYIHKDDINIKYTFLYKRLPERAITSDFFSEFSADDWRDFLIGLFEANGSCNVAGQISLKTTCKELANQVQIILGAFGIKSWICKNKEQTIKWKNGQYKSRESYNLQIAPRNGYIFKDKIGFLSNYKNDRIRKMDIPYKGKLIVTKIEDAGELEVWDFTNECHYEYANGIIAHNCSEEPLLPFEACVLASVDVAKLVHNKQFDWDQFKSIVSVATRFLDNTVTLSNAPLTEINETVNRNRKIGLGIMGFADAMILLGIKYGSEESMKFAEDISRTLQETAHNTSVELGKEKGLPENAKFYQNTTPGCQHLKGTPRNACVSSFAPTGTIASIADTSFGIEPLYDVCFIKNILDGKKIFFVNDTVKKVLLDHGLSDEVKQIENGKTLKEIKTIPQELRDLFVTTYELTPEQHVKIQAAFQKNCDSAISKTVNMLNSATTKDVEQAYLLAYDLGCKGITVYRDGSRQLQVVETGKGKTKETKPMKRPDIVNGVTYKIQTSFGKLYVTVNSESGSPVEVFLSMADISNDMSSLLSALGRMISVSLKHNTPIKDIIKTLKKIKTGTTVYYNGKSFRSVPQLVAGVLEEVFLGKESPAISVTACDKCGSQLIMQEGCEKCSNPDCGYTKCG